MKSYLTIYVVLERIDDFYVEEHVFQVREKVRKVGSNSKVLTETLL